MSSAFDPTGPLNTDRPAGPRKPLRCVEYPRPRCPECESAKLRAYRSIDNGDDTLTRYTACRACGHRFVLILE